MRRRILGLFFAAVLCFSLLPMAVHVSADENEYEVWVNGNSVNGVQITPTNKDDVLGDGTVSYDPTTNTVTLNNATITRLQSYVNSDLTVVVKGYCYVNINDTGNGIEQIGTGDLTITGDGELIVSGGSWGFTSGRNLTVNGSVNVITYYTVLGLSSGDGYDVTVAENASVTFNGSNTGIHSGRNIIFSSSGSVNIEADDLALSARGNVQLNGNGPVSIKKGDFDKEQITGNNLASYEKVVHSITGEVIYLTSYNVWVNGEEFTISKKVITCGTGTANLDTTSMPFTLTLDGAEITKTYRENRNSADCLIYTPYDINVVIKNDSKMYNPDSSMHAPGIMTYGNLTLTGSADLDISGYIDNGLDVFGYLTIDMEGDISIVSNGRLSGGMMGVQGLLISGSGDLTIDIAGRPGITAPQGTAILSKTGDINVSSSSGLGLQAQYDVVISGSGDVSIYGSSVNAIRVNRGELYVETYSVYLNGTNGVITLKTDAGNAAVLDPRYGTSPVAGTNLSAYECVTGAPDESSVVYRLAHSFTNYISDNNATCTEDGTKTAKCDNCNATDTQPDVGSATGHNFTTYTSNNDATCTADCTKTATCSNGCGETDTVTDTGSKLGHSFTNYVSDGNATCTADGTKTATCANGCSTTDTIADTGSAKGHTYGEWTTTKEPTLTEKGMKERTCTACGDKQTEEISVLTPATYSIISGANGEWTKGSTDGLVLTSDADFAKFVCVKVDGTEIAASNYTAVSGPTKITLNAAYLETLSEGSHSFEIVSNDGSTSTNFTVKAAAQPTDPTAPTSPQTGDNSNMFLWIALLFVSSGGLVGTAVIGKRRKRAE